MNLQKHQVTNVSAGEISPCRCKCHSDIQEARQKKTTVTLKSRLTRICWFSSRSRCTSICSLLHSSMIFFTSPSSSAALVADLGSAAPCSVLTGQAEDTDNWWLSLSCCGGDEWQREWRGGGMGGWGGRGWIRGGVQRRGDVTRGEGGMRGGCKRKDEKTIKATKNKCNG